MNRNQQLFTWAQNVLPSEPTEIKLLSGDASYRKYYRAFTNLGSNILVDSDPQHEKNHEFVRIASSLNHAGVCAPQVQAVDFDLGFMLLSDLGDDLLLSKLNPQNVEQLYSLAIDELVALQECQVEVRDYDEALLRNEMSLFHTWFLKKQLTDDERALINSLYDTLIESALAQPKVFVHLDYHSRNLMVLPNNRLGVIDFQDATIGPITYDLVSLLRDCYIAWPQDIVENFIDQYLTKINLNVDRETFARWFDWMGLQRHLKCVGIFTRLNERDNKPDYLNDIPRVLNYIFYVTEKYPEFSEFNAFLKKTLGAQ